jgi:hypothetical protein
MIKREPINKSNQVKVTFVVPHDPAQPRISVLGDFNAWDPNATPLVKRANNTRSASVTLDPNKQYEFRYRTVEGEWLDEAEADGYKPNAYGTQNCVIHT